MIGVGGVVLLLALWWLWATPRADQASAADQARIARVEERMGTLAEVEGRLRAVEARPAPADIRPMEQSIAALNDRIAGLERRIQAVEARPTVDPNALAARPAFEQLSTRATQIGERVEALTARQQEALRTAEQRATEAQARLAAVEQSVEQRLGAAQQQLLARLTAAEQQVGQRLDSLGQQVTQRAEGLTQQATQRTEAIGQQVGQRLDAADARLVERLATAEKQIADRVAAIEQRLSAAAAQATRFAAIDQVRAALNAGQPLGPTLARLQNPPAPLTRYATAAPPTESSLRLSFEEAVRAARAASDPARQGPDGAKGGIADTAVSRLSGLVTIRRGDQVVWGDSIEQPIERARRALVAGDLAQSVEQLKTLPPEVREAMKGWTEQAEALLAARAALHRLATTAQG
jgi:hypothetical protein